MDMHIHITFHWHYSLMDVQFGQPFKTFLDVLVNSLRVLAVSQKFEQIVVGKKIETWEVTSLPLQQIKQYLLTFIQLAGDVLQILEEVREQYAY